MSNRICIVDGIRTPMVKAGADFKDIGADELAAYCVKYLINKHNIKDEMLSEIIFGNVSMPHNAANISRVIALKAGLSDTIPAYTVQRNCASGMEAIIQAFNQVQRDSNAIIIAGGTESMSNIPLIYNKSATHKFVKLSMARTTKQKLNALLSFRFKDFSPIPALLEGLTDPVTGNIMGKTAEFLAREFNISRREQDIYAHQSHYRASMAQEAGIFADEILPIPLKPKYNKFIMQDIGIRHNLDISYLANKRAYFDRLDGTVTVGNSCQVTDGAAAMIITNEDTAKRLGLDILGYINSYSHAALSPDRMGLGPAYAIAKMLENNSKKLSDYDLFEVNEAFAAQVLANVKLLESDELCRKFFKSEKAIGSIDLNKLNVNGGAIAIGHPVGMSGTRIVMHLLKQLKRQNLKQGIASLCVGGGQGVAVEIELR
ncbi:MAG: thiolase family protein [Marinifilaceae bacterium]|jgi:acetyl-CoA acetyltransferase family protein|nr:thiolase family protein [Marinifilaceae bacterium]